jgi:hypothetical protein
MPLIVLSHYWKPLMLLALLAAAIAYRAVLLHQRDEARSQVTQLTVEAAALRTSNQALGTMIDRQNAAVAQLKAQADAAMNAMSASENAASIAAGAAESQAEQQGKALLTAPIDVNARCAGAIQWGNAQAAELSSW